MKEVCIACPRCHTDNTTSLATLKSNGGHVLCSECSFVFKVVPKRKSALADAVSIHASKAPPPNPHAQKLASAIQAISAAIKVKQAEAARAKADSSFLPVNTPPVAEPPTNTEAPPVPRHNTPVPSISILLKQTPAPVAIPNWNSHNLPFDLLDPVPPAPASQEGQVQIQTGNLVFTLLPSSNIEAAAPPIVINDAAAHSTEITQQQLALAAQQENLHRQFNWTLASLVALTVLIIQLFYLLSM